MHDINLALIIAKIILLKEGSIFAAGEPKILLITGISKVFDVDFDVAAHPITNKPYITFVLRHLLLIIKNLLVTKIL